MGLAFFTFSDLDWSWQFVLVELLIILVGRFLGTVGLISLMQLFGHERQVTFRELLFISYSGLIRGAIAFGLVVNIDHSIKERNVIITTTLALVVFTTVFFGSLMPLVQRFLLKPKDEHENEHSGDEGGNIYNVKINGSPTEREAR